MLPSSFTCMCRRMVVCTLVPAFYVWVCDYVVEVCCELFHVVFIICTNVSSTYLFQVDGGLGTLVMACLTKVFMYKLATE